MNKNNYFFLPPLVVTIAAVIALNALMIINSGFSQSVNNDDDNNNNNSNNTNDQIKAIVTNANLYIALLLGLITVIGSLTTLGLWLKKSINTENRNSIKTVDAKLDIRNEALTDLKNKMNKVESFHEMIIKNQVTLQEHERRITELERKVSSSVE